MIPPFLPKYKLEKRYYKKIEIGKRSASELKKRSLQCVTKNSEFHTHGVIMLPQERPIDLKRYSLVDVYVA